MPLTAIWILAADCGRARVFEAGREEKQLYHLKDFVNRNGGPDASKQNCSVDAGAEPGARQNPALQFALQVGEYLEKARTEQRYDGLYLIAPHQFLRVLRATLPKAVKKLVAEEFDQRLSDSRVDEIESQIRDKLKLAFR